MRTLARIGLDVDHGSSKGRRAAVKRLLAATAIVLAAGLCACGSASTGAGRSTSSAAASASSKTTGELSPAPLEARVDADRDNDVGAAEDDSNHKQDLRFGHAASPSERRGIAALVKRYYAAALAENGARGCAMLYSTLAEAAVEDDVREPGTPAYMHGATTCAQVLTALFKHYHAQLAAELPQLDVTHVRLEEHHGFAFLSFGKLAERKISVQRERHVWRMTQIYDEEMP
jgi:hypothetical protein